MVRLPLYQNQTITGLAWLHSPAVVPPLTTFRTFNFEPALQSWIPVYFLAFESDFNDFQRWTEGSTAKMNLEGGLTSESDTWDSVMWGGTWFRCSTPLYINNLSTVHRARMTAFSCCCASTHYLRIFNFEPAPQSWFPFYFLALNQISMLSNSEQRVVQQKWIWRVGWQVNQIHETMLCEEECDFCVPHHSISET